MIDFHDPKSLNLQFKDLLDEDQKALNFPDYFARWLFSERLNARGARQEMSFNYFEGLDHIRKFFAWHTNADFSDFFSESEINPLASLSIENDQSVFRKYELSINQELIEKIGRYNAQDQMFMHAYPVPERNKVRTLLDFGAGHGRLANLLFSDPNIERRAKTYFVLEAIPSTYFTQLAYLQGLGLKVWEYLDHCQHSISQDDLREAIKLHDVVHLPTWRHDLIPDDSIDMISCIQVLKEIPGPLVNAMIPIFNRVTHKTGAIYIRDHNQFHNPNHMPIETLLLANGFKQEFVPQLIDRLEIHGLPKIWRKVDPDHFINLDQNG